MADGGGRSRRSVAALEAVPPAPRLEHSPAARFAREWRLRQEPQRAPAVHCSHAAVCKHTAHVRAVSQARHAPRYAFEKSTRALDRSIRTTS